MELRSGFKETEVGAIPDDWEVIALAEACRSISDGTHFTPKYVTQGIPFYSVENVTANDFVNVKYISQAEHRLLIKRCRPERGDILMTRIGALGDTRILDWEVDASIYVSLALLKLNGRVNTEYLYRYTKSNTFLSCVERRGLVNATPQKINLQEIGSIPIPVPTNGLEQHAIATALSDVDALLDRLARLIAKKRDLKQATMQQLLTGQSRLPGFSGEWEPVEFGDIAMIRNAKVLSSSTPAGTQCVELESIDQGNGRLLRPLEAAGSSPKYSFKKGDVLFGRLRAYLRKYWLARFDGVCSTEIWPLIPRNERLCAGFLHLLVQTNDFVEAAGVSYGTHMPRSDWSVLAKLIVQLPSNAEQSAIATVLSDMDAELDALETRIAKTRALKQAMMQELLTGKTRLLAPEAVHA